MRRYVTQPEMAGWVSRDWMYPATDTTARTVHEQTDAPRATGLLDAADNQLFAVEDKPAIGFVRRP